MSLNELDNCTIAISSVHNTTDKFKRMTQRTWENFGAFSFTTTTILVYLVLENHKKKSATF